jgi:hypothetical protein
MSHLSVQTKLDSFSKPALFTLKKTGTTLSLPSLNKCILFMVFK